MRHIIWCSVYLLRFQRRTDCGRNLCAYLQWAAFVPTWGKCFIKLVVTVIECCDGCSCVGSCGGCPFSDFFAGVFITVVVRTPVGIDFGFGPEVVGVRGCNRGRCYGCAVVAILRLFWAFRSLWPLWSFWGVLGLPEVVVVVALVIVLGLWEVIARLGSVRFGHCGGLISVAGMFVVML